jgi:hypothetical protein
MFKPRRLGGVNLAAALAAGTLLSTTAMAATTTFKNAAATYAIEAVTGASGAITIASDAQFSVTGVGAGIGSFLLTITLPPGVLFNGTPTVTGDGKVCVGTATPPTLGGSGSNSAQFTIGAPASNPGGGTCTVTLNSFNVTGATALETASTQATPPTGTSSIGFNVTAQASGTSGSLGVASTTAIKVALAASEDEILLGTLSGLTGAIIDVNAPSLGTKFQDPAGAPDGSSMNPGFIEYGLTGALNATATGAFNLGGTSGTFVLTGNFNGLAAAFLVPARFAAPFLSPGNRRATFVEGGGCPATASAASAVPGAIAATLTGSTATFTGVNGAPGPNPFVPPGPAAEFITLCLYSGTAVVAANPPNTGAPAIVFGLTATVGTGTASANQTTGGFTPLVGYQYNGVVQPLLYADNGSVYPSFVRIVNDTGSTVPVFALVQGDGGSLGTATVESGLLPFHNDTVPVTTIVAAAGVTPGPYGRVSMIVFAPGPSGCAGQQGVLISGLMGNPDGTFVQMSPSGCSSTVAHVVED